MTDTKIAEIKELARWVPGCIVFIPGDPESERKLSVLRWKSEIKEFLSAVSLCIIDFTAIIGLIFIIGKGLSPLTNPT